MDSFAIFCAKYLVAVPVAIILYIELKEVIAKRYQLLAVSVLTSVFVLLLARLGAHLVTDPRPFMNNEGKALISSATDSGFPSDHMLLASMLAWFGWHQSKNLGLGLAVIALFVGWGRVAAHVHHLEDIIGSIIIASLAYWLAVGCLKLYGSRRSAQPVSN